MLFQIIFLFFTYAIAAIPFGLLLTKVFLNKDIREFGSKNIGATNVVRVAGKKLGFATLILDGAKGAIMVVIARFVFAEINYLHLYLVIVGFTAVLGHIYPIYLNFKGGKGVATSIAVLYALDLKLGFLVTIIWIVVFLIFRISSLSSLTAIASSILLSKYCEASFEQIVFCAALFAIIAFKHKENIIRLLKGEEKSFKKSKS